MSAAMFSGSPAGLTPIRTGTATIAAAGTSIAVADTLISANSIIVCNCADDGDATALVFSVGALSPGASFTIKTNAAATAAVVVRYAVLRY